MLLPAAVPEEVAEEAVAEVEEELLRAVGVGGCPGQRCGQESGVACESVTALGRRSCQLFAHFEAHRPLVLAFSIDLQCSLF